ncbi:MAG: cell division protein FtsL [Stellaceae bacterium]
MTRIGTLFWVLLVSAAAGGMYAVKYRVQGIEGALVKTEAATIAEQRQIRVLDAEWTYLNRPETLAQMNARFLSLVPITAKELRTSVADIPLRATPAPGNEGLPQSGFITVAAHSPPAAPPPRLLSAVLTEGPAARALPARRRADRREVVRRRVETAKAPSRAQTMPHRKSLDDLIARIVASR